MSDEELAAEVLKVIRRWSHSESSCVADATALELCRATMHNLIRMVFDHDAPAIGPTEIGGEAASTDDPTTGGAR